MSDTYKEFIERKSQIGMNDGFDPLFIPDFLFDFQKHLLEWAVKKGRGAIFADCGLGKTPMQLAWAENIIRKTNGKALIIAPLGVSIQTVREADKFGIDCKRSNDGKPAPNITVTNYEQLHKFTPEDFIGVVCDESSAIKNMIGKRQKEITRFMSKRPYRLLCTATPSPNDYIELGTSSEALGQLDRSEMLSRFFKNEPDPHHPMWTATQWHLKPHATREFWRWLCSWSRAVRKPSDLGFDDADFRLPKLTLIETVVENREVRNGWLFNLPAHGLSEEREERKATIPERCEEVARIINGRKDTSIAWCHLNAEGDLLEKLISGAVQVAGSNSDEEKEERLMAFAAGEIKCLVTKSKIAGFGLNFQSCSHMTFFPSHSFEQYYQSVRRCWRFGQKKPVRVDLISSDGESGVIKNLQRKATAADEMFSSIVAHMNEELRISRTSDFEENVEVPSWL